MEIPVESITPNDLVIAIMGPSGSGKSHFIDVLRRSGHRSRHRSNTSAVTRVQSFTVEHHEYNRHRRVVLVDFPAFGELETLTLVGEWLEKTYRRGVKLSGILYLHQISDNRVCVPDLKILWMFGELCGDTAMSRVIFVSTKWDQVDKALGEYRERELKDKIWWPMLALGSKTERFDNSSGSAKNIVDFMIINEEAQITLLIQEELVELEKRLSETHVAQLLNRTLQEMSSEQKASVQMLKDQASKEAAAKSPHFFQALKDKAVKEEKDLMKLLGDIQRLEVSRTRKLVVRFGRNEKKGKIKPLSIFSTSNPNPQPDSTPVRQTVQAATLSRQNHTSSKDSGHCEASRPSNETSSKHSDVHSQSYKMLLKVLPSPVGRRLVCNLRGVEAKTMVDFLHQLLCDHDYAEYSDKKKDILSLLSRLAQTSRVFPTQCKLAEVRCDLQKPRNYGGFGYIFKGEYQGHTVCVKAVIVSGDGRNAGNLKVQARELILWTHLSHQNVVPLYGYHPDSDISQRILIVSPWMQHGDLEHYLRTFPENPRMPLISDINSGLHYLHERCIIHADLKATNILVSGEHRAMITDFGISRVFLRRQSFTATPAGEIPGGTDRWMAPELLSEEYLRPTKESDIWSFGCICYEVLVGKHPFHQYHRSAPMIYGRATTCTTPLLPDEVNHVDPKMRDLMEWCWKKEPEKRPTCEEIRVSLNRFEIKDDRPKIGNECDSAFSQVKAARSSVTIDYQFVHRILCRVQQARTFIEEPMFSEGDGESHAINLQDVVRQPQALTGRRAIN